jgi:hypothetical protein
MQDYALTNAEHKMFEAVLDHSLRDRFRRSGRPLFVILGAILAMFLVKGVKSMICT